MAHKVLIVDDTQFMRKMLADCLTQNGFEVAGEAGNGREAILRYEELRPDIVMMDINMPEMSGIEAIKEILRLDAAAVILVCTAANQQEAIVEAMEAGAKGYVVKPFKPNRVIDIIRMYAVPHLSQKEGEDVSISAAEFAAEAEPTTAVESKLEEEIGLRYAEVPSLDSVSISGKTAEDQAESVSTYDMPKQVHTEHTEHTEHTVHTKHMERDQDVKEVPAFSVQPSADKPATSTRRNGNLKSFISSIMCNWQEEIDGETAIFTVVCTESENKVLIEMTDENQVKHSIQFTIDGLRQLGGWLEDHMNRKTAV